MDLARDENVDAARSVGWCAELIEPADDPTAQMRSLLRRHEVLI